MDPRNSRFKPWKRDPWGVLLESPSVLVDAASVTASRRSLDDLAEHFGGTYDGWEASARP
jgi:hypothetical protein